MPCKGGEDGAEQRRSGAVVSVEKGQVMDSRNTTSGAQRGAKGETSDGSRPCGVRIDGGREESGGSATDKDEKEIGKR